MLPLEPASDTGRAAASLSVSAIIPAFNRERFIVEAIESALRQDRRPQEIIVVDDASSDQTAARAAAFKEVRVVRLSKRGGPAGARNAGIGAARGDLIAWLDSDDLWLPRHCSTIVPLLERFPDAVLAFGGVEFVGQRDGLWPVGDFPDGMPFDAFEDSFERNVPPMMATIIRRDALTAVEGLDATMACSVDFDLFLRLSRLGPFVCSHMATAQYRWHGEQLSAKPLSQLEAIYTARLKMLRALAASGERARALVLQQRVLKFLETDLWTAWGKRDLTRLRALMKVAGPFDARTVTGRFRYRQLAPQLLMTAWDRLQRNARSS